MVMRGLEVSWDFLIYKTYKIKKKIKKIFGDGLDDLPSLI